MRKYKKSKDKRFIQQSNSFKLKSSKSNPGYAKALKRKQKEKIIEQNLNASNISYKNYP
jgi:hypothetical protein